MAKYGKCKYQSKIRSQLQRGKWRREEPQGGNKRPRTIVRLSQEAQGFKQAMVGEVNSEFEEWLSRSLVCTTEEPKDLATFSSAILQGYGQCSKVCALSSDKFILTFDNEELMEEALRNHEELDVWFKDIIKWSKYETCESRKVWVEVFGVPPRGWCWEN